MPPRSISRSTASTPTPPPLVRIARRLPGKRLLPPERLGGGEQLVEVEHAQQPGAAERGVIDRIGAGERAGVRRRGPRALRVPARLDHDDRLRARGGAGRRHELARVVDRLRCRAGSRGCRGRRRNSRGSRRNRRRPCRRATRRAEKPTRRCAAHSTKPRRDGARLRDQREIARRRAAAPRSWR